MSDVDVYTLIEARVQSLVQTYDTDFDDASVRLGDPRALDSGKPPYLFLTPGAFRKPRLSPRSVDAAYGVDIALVERAYHDGTEWTNLKTRRYGLTNLFEKYPTLNNLVSEASGYQVYFADIQEGARPYYLPPKTEGALSDWLVQEMTMTVKVITVIDGGEYG